MPFGLYEVISKGDTSIPDHPLTPVPRGTRMFGRFAELRHLLWKKGGFSCM